MQPMTEKEKAIVRALQQDLPLVPEPYKVLAASVGMTEEELIAGAKALQERGCMKRIAVSLIHQHVGFTTNVMVVWDIPDDLVSRIGSLVSAHPAVTHCYCRCRHEDFPYNFYTMVHCQSEAEYETVIAEIQDIMADILPEKADHAGLKTLSELKKSGMLYFEEKQGEIIGEA